MCLGLMLAICDRLSNYLVYPLLTRYFVACVTLDCPERGGKPTKPGTNTIKI